MLAFFAAKMFFIIEHTQILKIIFFVSFCVLCIFIFKPDFRTLFQTCMLEQGDLHPESFAIISFSLVLVCILCLIRLDTWFSPENPHHCILLDQKCVLCECLCVHIIREQYTVSKCAAEQLVNSMHLAALAKH